MSQPRPADPRLPAAFLVPGSSSFADFLAAAVARAAAVAGAALPGGDAADAGPARDDDRARPRSTAEW